MDKPDAMSVKDYLLRIMSVRMNIPEKTIEAVMKHQFEGVIQALNVAEIYTVEVSGFGKFMFNPNKAIKKIAALEIHKAKLEQELLNPATSETRRKSIERDIKSTGNYIEIYKEKINASKSNMGGVEKQAGSSSGNEGNDRGDLSGETEDLPELPIVFREQEEGRVGNNTF